MAKKKKEEVREFHCLDIKITGDDLDDFLRDYLKEKLGDIEINLLELTDDDNMSSGILNSDVSKFNVFVEYLRK